MPRKGQPGPQHDEETRKRISEAVKKAYAEGRLVSHRKLHKGDGTLKGFTGRHTEATKAKISTNRKGKALGNRNGFTEGHTPHNKAKPHPVHTPEWRAKVSAANSGASHWNWKGGIDAANRLERNSTRHKDWSLAVLERDRWTCRNCGAKGRDLVAHHVVPFSQDRSLRYEVSNGLTLCRACHCEIHRPRLGTGKPPKRHQSSAS